MSLDVQLIMRGVAGKKVANCIFVREDGVTRTITREEWDKFFPNEAILEDADALDEYVFSANITHNLNVMADNAGIYECLWRPEEVKITKASQLIAPLKAGLERLKSDPEHFKQFNAKNGWGLYEHLMSFVEKYLAACEEYPDADVEVSR